MKNPEADRSEPLTPPAVDSCADADRDQAIRRKIRAIQRLFARRRTADTRTPEEIIGYDEHGLPT